MTGYSDRVKARLDARRSDLGTNFKRRKDGVTYAAQIRTAQVEEIEALRLEGGISILELNPIVLDNLPLTCPLSTGDFVLYPATGSAADSNYRVVSVQDKRIQNVPIKRVAVAVAQFDRS